MNALIAEVDEVAERRLAERLPALIEAKVRPFGEEGREARILNISATGFMAVTREHYTVGARVWLILPGRERANAVIKWTAADRIGAEFTAPIDLAGLTL